MERTYDQAVSAWATHLRDGGTTPWSRFRETEDAELAAPEVLQPVPDAVHLELVRRLVLLAGDQPITSLVDRVLATGSPGRGLLDVPLPWPAAPRRFGTPAIDPDALPEEELVRLAVGVLTHLAPGVPEPTATVRRPRWPLPWRRRFRLHGSPGTVAGLRRILLDQGLVESDWRPTHVVVARPVEVMMAEHWQAATGAGGILKWSTLWRRARAADRLPGPIDVTALASSLHERSRGRERVHVVLARDTDEAVQLTTRLLRARPRELPTSGDPAQTDLLRRFNRLTALTHGPDRVQQLAAVLVSLLSGITLPGEGPAPVVPAHSLSWAEDIATRTSEDLARAGYAVHGDPGILHPTEHRLPGTIDRDRTLEVALRACLRAWQLQEGTP